jgi:hypothetical protein
MPTAATASKTASRPVPVPNGDFYQLVELLTPEEKAVVTKVRTYMQTKVQPIIDHRSRRLHLTSRRAGAPTPADPRKQEI